MKQTVHLLAILWLAGCARLFGPSPVLNVAIPTDPVSLEGEASSDPATLLVLHQLQRGLIQADAGGRAVGDLAEGWSVDSTGRRYSFVLGKHRWSDGVELSAGDFVFAWRRALQSKPGAWNAPLLHIAGARAFASAPQKDFHTVGLRAMTGGVLEVILETPDSQFPLQLAHPALGPQREDIYQLHPTAFADPLHLRTIGPYQILEWKRGESLLLVANSYSLIQPSVAKVRLLVVSDAKKAQQLFDQGAVDVLTLTGGSAAFRVGPRATAVPLGAHGVALFSQVQWK